VSAYNRPDWIDLSATADPPTGFVEDLLQQWSSGKPQYAFIEASNQSGGATFRAPTADELRGEVWDAIIHGAHGIFYFPQAPNVDDGVPAALVSEMTTLDAQLAQLGPMLAAGGITRSAAAPFEGATRTYCGVTYTMTLNFSHNPATYAGSIFEPYQLKISPTPPNPLPRCPPDPIGLGAGTSSGPAGAAGLSTGSSARHRARAPKRCIAPTRRRPSSPRVRTACKRGRPAKCGRARRCRTCRRSRSSRACRAASRKSRQPDRFGSLTSHPLDTTLPAS
jgi:hypothetical protein